MRHTPLIFMILLTGMLLPSCGSERSLSGIWQQVACDPVDASVPCPGRVLELHLGRFGQGLTGLVVEYETESQRTTFDGSSECECAFIKSGYAVDDNLRFSIDPEEVPIINRCTQAPMGPMGADELPCSLHRVRFDLAWDGEFLVGTMFCQDNESTVVDVKFVEATGQPRTRCSNAPTDRAGQ